MILTGQQLFWAQAILGPYIMTYAFSFSFWVRIVSGYLTMSHSTTQVLSWISQDTATGTQTNELFGGGQQVYLAMCMANGVTGAFLAALSEPLGLLFLELAGVYILFTWSVVSGCHFRSPKDDLEVANNGNMTRNLHLNHYKLWHHDDIGQYGWVFVALAITFVFILILSVCRIKLPHRIKQIIAGFTGAAVGSHCTLEAIYVAAGMQPEVSSLLAANHQLWCHEPFCKLYYTVFWVLCLISLITQHFVASTIRSIPREEYQPVKVGREYLLSQYQQGDVRTDGEYQQVFQGESTVDGGDTDAEIASPGFALRHSQYTAGWDNNLRTSRVTWVFLFCVVAISSTSNYVFCNFVDWNATRLEIGLLYVLTNAFLLWATAEFFTLTIWFHVVRLIWDLPPLPALDFSNGLPPSGRTVLAYCLLSKQESSSRETFETALDAHLANLDPRGRVTTGVVSVSSLLTIVQCEMRCRDEARDEIRRVLSAELNIVMRMYNAGRLNVRALARELRNANIGARASGDRATFWRVALDDARQGGVSGTDVQDAMRKKIEQAAKHFVYLHRNCRILKKPGQYQDLIVLGASGNNQAYTYLKEDYGKLGRDEDSDCFGFSSNIENNIGDTGVFEKMRNDLEANGREDIDLVAGLGSDPKTRYHYTMVLDSDTVCPPKSIRKLVQVAEHQKNQKYGIINANLASDYSTGTCTWHMWRSALLEVSTVNLQRGQFWIFDRTGFYGKGLVRNSMYIERVIGMPGEVLEALPIDILSHDTVEAKLLQPGIALDVTLYEDIARNPISGLAQSTRWMLGEVRNETYHSGAYQSFIHAASNMYSQLTKCKPIEIPYIRWSDVPCSVAAEYLSHTGMRLFHAGPALVLINLSNSVLARWQLGLSLRTENVLGGQYILLFVILALFIIPKGFLVLDKLPSCRLGWKFGYFSMEDSDEDDYDGMMSARSGNSRIGLEDDLDDDDEPMSRCGILIRQLLLAILEVIMSLLLFSPELILGCIRLFKGVKAQITGRAGWVPQDVVEKEVEEKVAGPGGLWFVFTSTWMVFLVGISYATYLYWAGIYDVVLGILVASWILYPFTTYLLCLCVPDSCQDRWLWTWVMDLKMEQAAEAKKSVGLLRTLSMSSRTLSRSLVE